MAFTIAPDAYAYLSKQARQIVAGASRALPNEGHLVALLAEIEAQAARVADLQRTLAKATVIVFDRASDARGLDDTEAALSTGMGDVEVDR